MLQRLRSDRGAAAVEFALVLPVLVLLVFGIIEFGRIFNVQNSVSAAALEGARVVALQKPYSDADMRQAVKNAAPSVAIQNSDITPSAACSSSTPGPEAKVTVRYQLTLLTGIVGTSITLTGKGVMRCGG